MLEPESPGICILTLQSFITQQKTQMNKMHCLYKIPVTVLLTQELTSLHVVSGLKSDQRLQLGLCMHGDLRTTSELPELNVSSLLSHPQKAPDTVFEDE